MASPAMAGALGGYMLSQFDVESMVGRTYAIHAVGSRTETQHWNSPVPISSSYDDVGQISFLPISLTIDGHPANVRFVQGPTPTDNDSYMHISNTTGIIDFGNLLGVGVNYEHLDNGRTFLPASLPTGVVLVDPRTTSWSGQWSDGEDWTGSYLGSLETIGFETIDLPTGPTQALRVDFGSTRTKVGVSGIQTATEDDDGSMWLVDGRGIVRFESNASTAQFRTDFNNGNSPIYESEENETVTLFTRGDLNGDGVLTNGTSAISSRRSPTRKDTTRTTPVSMSACWATLTAADR